MQEVKTEWADWMLVAWGALLCEGIVWMLWCQCQPHPRDESQAGRTWRTDGTTKGLRETPVDLSMGLSRDVQTSWMCVYLCVCFGWRPAAGWSWDVKDDTCVSAGEGVCCHCQWGWDWSTSPLTLISFSTLRSSSFSSGGQLLWAPSHSGAVSGWPLRNFLGVFLECSVSLYNNQKAVEEVSIMVKHAGHIFYLQCCH